jgi:hypothetical protein
MRAEPHGLSGAQLAVTIGQNQIREEMPDGTVEKSLAPGLIPGATQSLYNCKSVSRAPRRGDEGLLAWLIEGNPRN